MSANSQVYDNSQKWTVAIITGLLFLLISSPFLYSLVNQLTSSFGLTIATNGCPNAIGLILHTIVFILIVRLLMR